MNLAVFDIDGTLTDTNAIDDDCFAEAVRRILGREISTDWNAYEHVTDSGILAGLGASSGEFARVRETFFSLLRECEVREIEGAARLIAALRAKHDWRVAYATGGWEPSARMKLAAAGLPLDVPLATSDDAPSRREIIERAIQRARDHYACDFDRIVLIGDGAWDRRCAEELQLPFVGEIDWRDTEAALARLAATYVLRFFFDPGSGICLWSGNDAANDRFDYPIELDLLPLSAETAAMAEQLMARFDTSIDWNDPGGPSPWSVRDEEAFAADARTLLGRIRRELGAEFEVRDEVRR